MDDIPVIGHADLLVTPRLASNAAQSLKAQVAGISAQVTQGDKAFNLVPKVDTKEAQAKLSGLGGFFKNLQGSANQALGGIGLDVRSLGIALGTGFLAGNLAGVALRVGIQLIQASIKFMGEAVQDASGRIEALSASTAIFGNEAAGIASATRDAATALGLTQREALEAANAFGTLFANTGATREQMALLSTGALQLAADLASLFNIEGGTAEVTQRLRAGFAGQPETLRQLGIIVTETTTKQFAFNNAIAKTGETITPQAAILLRFVQAVDQTSAAQGDFARTSDQLANSQRIMRAEFKEAKTAIGDLLLPVVKGLTDAGITLAIAVKRDVEAIKSFGGAIASAAEHSQILLPLIRMLGSIGHAILGDFHADLAKARKEALEAAKAAQAISKEREDSLTAQADAARQIPGDLLAVSEAERNVERATISERQAVEKLTDARIKQSRSSHDLAAAELGVARAQLGRKQADLGVLTAANSLNKATLDQKKALLDTRDILSGDDRKERLVDVTLDAAEAHVALNHALEDEKKNLLDVANAQNDLLHAQFEFIGVARDRHRGILALGDATLKVATAEQKLKDAQIDKGTGPLTVGRAQLTAARADREAGRFDETQALREADAKLRLQDVELAVQSSKLGTEAANLSVRDSILQVETATFRLDDTRREMLRQDDEVRLAELAVASAHDNVSTAVLGLAAANLQLFQDTEKAKGNERDLRSEMDVFNGVLNAHADLLDSRVRPSYQGLAGDIRAARDEMDRLRASAADEANKTPWHIADPLAGVDTRSTGGKVKEWAVELGIEFLKNVWKGLSPFRAGGNVIPGAQFGATFNARSKLIHVGESGDEILKITPGGRADIIPHGRTANAGATYGDIHIHESASGEATWRHLEWRIGMESQR